LSQQGKTILRLFWSKSLARLISERSFTLVSLLLAAAHVAIAVAGMPPTLIIMEEAEDLHRDQVMIMDMIVVLVIIMIVMTTGMMIMMDVIVDVKQASKIKIMVWVARC